MRARLRHRGGIERRGEVELAVLLGQTREDRLEELRGRSSVAPRGARSRAGANRRRGAGRCGHLGVAVAGGGDPRARALDRLVADPLRRPRQRAPARPACPASHDTASTAPAITTKTARIPPMRFHAGPRRRSTRKATSPKLTSSPGLECGALHRDGVDAGAVPALEVVDVERSVLDVEARVHARDALVVEHEPGAGIAADGDHAAPDRRRLALGRARHQHPVGAGEPSRPRALTGARRCFDALRRD